MQREDSLYVRFLGPIPTASSVSARRSLSGAQIVSLVRDTCVQWAGASGELSRFDTKMGHLARTCANLPSFRLDLRVQTRTASSKSPERTYLGPYTARAATLINRPIERRLSPVRRRRTCAMGRAIGQTVNIEHYRSLSLGSV